MLDTPSNPQLEIRTIARTKSGGFENPPRTIFLGKRLGVPALGTDTC
jgi:hypothetical protein